MRSPNALELVGPEKPLHPDHEMTLKHFLGKSQEEARAFYPGRTHYLTEFFMWMTPTGLSYYLPPFLDYLKSEDAVKDAREDVFGAGAGSVLGTLARLIEEGPPLPNDFLCIAKEISAYIKQHCKRFGISPHDEWYRECLKSIEGAKLSGSD